ncbi:MAG TPA: glycosyltransferase [Rhodospirillales bacterium]|nr:glycosyltransferase [Rhodospirillales bacterium]
MDNTTLAPVVEPGVSGGSGRFATVLQVLPALGKGGGVERGVVEIADAITAAGGRALVASSGGEMVMDIKRARAKHFTLPAGSKNPLVMQANIGRLAKLIEAEGVDIVHARSRAPAWSAYFAAKRAGVHFVTTFHGTYAHGNWFKRRYNAIMTRGERVIAISDFIAGHMGRVYGTPASKIRTIHRGVDVKYFNPRAVGAERISALSGQWRLGDGAPVVMLPGRLTRWKGQTVFIQAVAKLKRRDIRCLLVGSDQGRGAYRQELGDLLTKYDLNEIVRIVDHCNDMPAAYMLTDVVVSASTDPEAFGRVAPEAQALGRPVIATDHGGARETIIEGATGWLTPPGDVDALAQAIARVLALTETERRRLAEQAIANVRKNFSKETMCARTLDVYNEVLS